MLLSLPTLLLLVQLFVFLLLSCCCSLFLLVPLILSSCILFAQLLLRVDMVDVEVLKSDMHESKMAIMSYGRSTVSKTRLMSAICHSGM